MKTKFEKLMLAAIILLAVVLALLLPKAVNADELWVQNQGGLEVVVEYEGDTATVTADSGICVINPDYGDGTAKAAAADIQAGWVVIEADNITGYTIEVACNQKGEDVTPEVLIVIDYEGTRIGYNPTETTREAMIAALEAVGPPPPPPGATNTQDWVDPFNAPATDDSDGQSVRDMDNEAFLAAIDWTGQDEWRFS